MCIRDSSSPTSPTSYTPPATTHSLYCKEDRTYACKQFGCLIFNTNKNNILNKLETFYHHVLGIRLVVSAIGY